MSEIELKYALRRCRHFCSGDCSISGRTCISDYPACRASEPKEKIIKNPTSALLENLKSAQQRQKYLEDYKALFGKQKKIAILGKLETKYDAPFDNPEWEIWSMNKHKDEELIPRVDKWFDIHINPDKKDADVLREDFPFEECKRLAGGNYFVTVTSYLIAYAILQGAGHIALYGMRFTIDHERRQRELENVRQWIFFAKGRGIEVTIPSDKEYLLPEHVIKEGEDYDQ